MTFTRSSIPAALLPEPRKALILIDFQNDFTDQQDGRLHVPNIDPFIGRLSELTSQFRPKGLIVFAQTEFHEARSALSPEWGSHNILLQEHLPRDPGSPEQTKKHRRVRSSLPVDPEAFLQAGIQDDQRSCRPGTAGVKLSHSLIEAYDQRRDLSIIKSHYSAFKDTPLLIQLRMRMVQHLYIAGSLSNVGVYATVTDAVRHGFQVTLIEDCLGYRDEQCHIEAVKQMADMMGASGIDYQELMDDLAGLLGDVIREEDLGSKFQISFAPSKPPPTLPPMTRTPLSPERKQQQVEDWLVNHKACDPGTSKTIPESCGISEELEVDPTVDYESYPGERSAISHTYGALTGSMSPRRPPSAPSNAAPNGGDSVRNSSQRSSAHRGPSDSPRYKVGRARIRTSRPLSGFSIPSGSTETPKTPNALAEIMAAIAASETVDANDVVSPVSSNGTGSDGTRSNSKSKRRIHVDLNALVKAIQSSPPARKKKTKNTVAFVGAAEPAGEGDSHVIGNVITHPEADAAFYTLKRTVRWQKMFHRTGEVPRLVAVQGALDEASGVEPIYRHPADESPEMHAFDETVDSLRLAAEKHVGHSLNHVLIQYYRSGEDNISEHSDKTLDITRGSSIVNFSLGAQRNMTLRTKKPDAPKTETSSSANKDEQPLDHTHAHPPNNPITPEAQPQPPSERTTQRVPMMHNSIFILGPRTNQYWLHSVRADKRLDSEKVEEELAYAGERISLTFRSIATFVDRDTGQIWGQGARVKTRPEIPNGPHNEARNGFKGKEKAIIKDEPQGGTLLTGEEAEREGEKMIRAFGQENHRSSTWDWDEWYGEGFDVVNFETRVVDGAAA